MFVCRFILNTQIARSHITNHLIDIALKDILYSILIHPGIRRILIYDVNDIDFLFKPILIVFLFT